MKNIILLFGGKSAEHDISIITAMQALASLSLQKYQVYPVYITKQNQWFWAKGCKEPKQFANFDEKKFAKVFVKSGSTMLFREGKFANKALCKIDVAIIACHGLCGEDGTLQGLLELAGVPYTSSGVAASALCMDKVLMKQIFEVNNFPVTKYIWFYAKDYHTSPQKIFAGIKRELDFPVVVKPANLGSSIGITVCKNALELEKAINIALNFDNKILVEEAVEHLREFNCACFGDEMHQTLSSINQPAKWNDFFGFDQKYLQKNIKTIKNQTPVLSKELRAEIRAMTKQAYRLFGASGVVRVDFLLNFETEELFIGEINSIPGSFSYFMFDNLQFGELLDKMIELAEKKFAEKNACKYCYESAVLLQDFVAKK